MANPATAFPRNAMPGEPTYGSAPRAIGGKAQPLSGTKLAKPKTVKVKAHTRVVQPKPPQAPAPPNDQALINAAVNTRYAPQEQALNAQLAQNARFNSGTHDWYANAQQEIRNLQQQGQANSQQTLGQITSYTSQPTLPNATDQQAATARNNLNAEFANQFGRDAVSNSDSLDRLRAAYLSQEGNTQNQTNAQRIGLLGQQGTLGQQKADYGLTYGSQLAQAEQKAALDQANLNFKEEVARNANLIKENTLNKVQIPLAQSLKQNRTAGQKVARSGVRLKKQGQADTRNQNAVKNQLAVNNLVLKSYLAAHPELKQKGGSGGFTPTQTRKAAATFRTLAGTMDETQVHNNPQGAIEALVKGKKTDPVVANAVVESILNNGSVSRNTATAYYRATGHHLHVSGKVKPIAPSIGSIVQGVLGRLAT